MPKGDQQDVPGPFSGMRMHVRRTVKTGQLTTPQPVLRFHDDMDQDGRDELVALLNKGTHYVRFGTRCGWFSRGSNREGFPTRRCWTRRAAARRWTSSR